MGTISMSRKERKRLEAFSRVKLGGMTLVEASKLLRQGQRTLSCFCGKDLHQEVVVPTGDLALAFDAVIHRMLLQQANAKTAKPGEIVGQTSLTRPTLVFVERYVEHPMQRVLNAPMATHRLCKPLAA